ncbi:MAG: hypothetical protein ACOX1T_02920 [Saccharofermentanales bacterium]
MKKVYLKYLLESLREDICLNNYCKTERHISMIISQCIAQGWSTRGLFSLSVCFEGDLSAGEKWVNFTDKISCTATKEFRIYYSIKLETRHGFSADLVRSTIASLGLNSKRGIDIIKESSGLVNLHSKLSSESTYIIIVIESYDLHSG